MSSHRNAVGGGRDCWFEETGRSEAEEEEEEEVDMDASVGVSVDASGEKEENVVLRSERNGVAGEDGMPSCAKEAEEVLSKR